MNPFLMISGHIASNKQKEFEQTFSIGFNNLPKTCLKYTLSEDTNNPGLFHFFSVWKDKNAFLTFKGSHEFQLLNGVFHALGSVDQVISGNVFDNDMNHYSIPEF